MIEQDLLQALDFLHEKPVFKFTELLQRQVAIFEDEVFLTGKAVPLDDVSPRFAFDHIEDLVQLSSSQHELEELVAKHHLRILVIDSQVILLREERSSFLADWPLLDVVRHVEEAWDDKLLLV